MSTWDHSYQPILSDFIIGQTIKSYARTVTETDLINFTQFAGMSLPIFIDAEYAKTEGPHGERICPGFMTASIAGGMLERILGHHVIAGLGMDAFQFKMPVKINDTLHIEVLIIDQRLTKNIKRGVLSLEIQTMNQRGQQVLIFKALVLMKAS
jgi:acyl dehydratase